MASGQLNDTVLRFRGLPSGVECIAPFELGVTRQSKPASRLAVRTARGEVPSSDLRIFHLSAGVSRLWFPLPPYTPPGTYDGSVTIGGVEFPITIDVEPHENLVLSPPQLNVMAAPGDYITTHFTLANAGNITCDIGKGHAFGLFDVEGAERAVGATLRDTTPEGRDKVNRLMDRLADEHAGFVRLQIEKGDGPIAAGEVRELTVRLRFPDNMKPNRAYTGTWVLFNLAYQLRVSARAQEDSQRTTTTTEEKQQ
jgi:hypothetical protein